MANGAYSTEVHNEPVTDWHNDFDHTDAAWSNDPFPIWDELRLACPVAHSPRYGGAWLPTRHADIAAIAHDTDHFTSRDVIISTERATDPAPIGGAPPITSDPPFHAIARRLLLPAFAPQPINALADDIRMLCRRLLDEIEASGATIVDAANAYAAHIPVDVIGRMLGLPLEDAELFRGFVHEAIENVAAPPDQRREGFARMDAYLDGHILPRVDNPQNDLISYLLGVDVPGLGKLAPNDVRGVIALLLIAGIDTTWSAIGSSLWHLAQHPDHVTRLRAEPELWPTAIEELLRAYAPVTMARLVKESVEIGGRKLEPEDWVLLPFPAANRDPEAFERADEVLLDREENRHAAFGLGIHRCLGSNLARLELRIAVEEWVNRFEKFSLADAEAVHWSTGQVRGPRHLPLTLGS